jgi:hypothetical protein
MRMVIPHMSAAGSDQCGRSNPLRVPVRPVMAYAGCGWLS